MTVSFNAIPNNIRIPFMTAEFDSANAIRGAQNQVYKALLLGQMLDAGIAEPGKPVRVHNKNEGHLLFGRGSMLAEMADYYRRTDDVTELWAVPVPDDAGGVAAAGARLFRAAPPPKTC